MPYNKADLLRRGWTRTSIKRILGEPDRKLLRIGIRKDRPECIYDSWRVFEAEEAGAVRYRKAPERPIPSDLDYWDPKYVPQEVLNQKRAKRAVARKRHKAT